MILNWGSCCMTERDDFESPFEEQWQQIQQEFEEVAEDLGQLPPLARRPGDYKYFCFPVPEATRPAGSPQEILANLWWLPESRKRSAAMVRDFADPDLLKGLLLQNLTSAGHEAAARILAILVCAEESAVNIFQHEAARVEEEQIKANHQALLEIETEERVHDWLIQTARAHYPKPDDIVSIKRRTRRLFMRVASRDLGVHFARISGLDSGVCICLTALLGSKTVTAVPGFARLLRHIRRDEAGHVKKARAHAGFLGFDASGFGDAYDLTRSGMVDMLTPIAPSFETMGVDPDRLFKRLLRFQAGRTDTAVD